MNALPSWYCLLLELGTANAGVGSFLVRPVLRFSKPADLISHGLNNCICSSFSLNYFNDMLHIEYFTHIGCNL